MSTIFTSIGVALAMVGALYGWLFVLKYRQYDWRKYAAGRHLMRFTTGIAVILTWSVFGLVLRFFFDGNWLVGMLLDTGRVVIFGWVAAMLFVRYQLLEESEDTNERNRNHGPAQ